MDVIRTGMVYQIVDGRANVAITLRELGRHHVERDGDFV
jgi:hypothetical protein